jgi:hypothetical protein
MTALNNFNPIFPSVISSGSGSSSYSFSLTSPATGSLLLASLMAAISSLILLNYSNTSALAIGLPPRPLLPRPILKAMPEGKKSGFKLSLFRLSFASITGKGEK